MMKRKRINKAFFILFHNWPPHPDSAALHDEKKEDKQSTSFLHSIMDDADLKRKKINNKLSILLQSQLPHSYTAAHNEG